MKKDQLLTRRRALITGAAAVGAAGAAGLFTTFTGNKAAPPPAPPVAGPPAPRPLRPGCGPPRAGPARPPVRSEPLLRVSGRARTMVLTFDDGPDPRYTPAILDTLAEYDVRAMFFVCGEMASYNKELLARMAEEGHTVGNHTWSHPLLTKLSRGRIRSEME